MEQLEKINQVEKLLVDTKQLMQTIDEMYYKKNYDEIDDYKDIKETDRKFRNCRILLMRNLEKIKKYCDLNFNLFLALQLHLTVMQNEIQRLSMIEVEEEKIINEVKKIEDDSTTEESEYETTEDDDDETTEDDDDETTEDDDDECNNIKVEKLSLKESD